MVYPSQHGKAGMHMAYKMLGPYLLGQQAHGKVVAHSWLLCCLQEQTWTEGRCMQQSEGITGAWLYVMPSAAEPSAAEP